MRKQNNISKKATFQNSIDELRKKYNIPLPSDMEAVGKSGIVDIITFCNSPKYLNLVGNNFKLFRSQTALLKCLYMNTVGNENVSLTSEEWDWLENVANYYKDDHQKMLQKIRENISTRTRFSELTLVLGRRAGKTTISSVISAYEIYKLLSIEGGDPYKFYNIPKGQEIAVLNVATSFKQAKRLFSQIKDRLDLAPYFQNRIAPSSGEEIRLYTDHDLKRLEDKDRKLNVTGSVVIVCGHSNPDSLRGYAAICIIFDELGFYDESKMISGKAFYQALKPSVAQFAEKGYDAGVLVEISTPGPKSGVLYKLYEESLDDKNKTKLSFRLPTWIFNERMTEDNPVLADAKRNDPEYYSIEYGSQWPEGASFGKYFSEEMIKRSVKDDLISENAARPGKEYYIHIDPAQCGDRYALAVVRKDVYREGGRAVSRVVLIFTKTWEPKPKVGLDYMAIDREILEICRRYRPVVVSYDTWNSISSTEFLRRSGFNCIQTTFNRGYKAKIYQNLKELMVRPSEGLHIYNDPLLIGELTNLSYRPTARSISIGKDPNSDYPTDDLSDCLAGAAFLAAGYYYKRLPSTMVARTGFR